MSSLVEILLEEGSHKVHLLVTTLTTTKMVLSSIQALSNPSEYTLVLEGSGEQDIVLVDDVPVLSCKRRPGDRLLVRRRPGPDGMTRQLLAVSLGLQETAARQFRVIENIRLVAVMHPTTHAESSVMATINEFVSRQCDSVEMRTLDFLSLYQQSDVHPRVQKIAELYRQIIADGGLHYLKIPPADNSGGVIPRAPSRQSLTEFSAVPAVAPAAVAVQPLPRYASPGIDADVLDPKAANKRRRLEANSPHTTLLPLGQMTSVKSGRRGSASSLSSSDDSDGSSSEADGPPRGVIIPQPGMMPFQDITPKHASLTVRQPSFASSQHGDSVVVPIAIQAGRYRSASSVPASSASSASSQSSTSGSESDQEAEEAKPSVTIKDTQVVHEMIAGKRKSRSSSGSSGSSSASDDSSERRHVNRLSMGLKCLVEHLPGDITFQPADYLPGSSGKLSLQQKPSTPLSKESMSIRAAATKVATRSKLVAPSNLANNSNPSALQISVPAHTARRAAVPDSPSSSTSESSSGSSSESSSESSSQSSETLSKVSAPKTSQVIVPEAAPVSNAARAVSPSSTSSGSSTWVPTQSSAKESKVVLNSLERLDSQLTQTQEDEEPVNIPVDAKDHLGSISSIGSGSHSSSSSSSSSSDTDSDNGSSAILPAQRAAASDLIKTLLQKATITANSEQNISIAVANGKSKTARGMKPKAQPQKKPITSVKAAGIPILSPVTAENKRPKKRGPRKPVAPKVVVTAMASSTSSVL